MESLFSRATLGWIAWFLVWTLCLSLTLAVVETKSYIFWLGGIGWGIANFVKLLVDGSTFPD
jgi:hypothetical protein